MKNRLPNFFSKYKVCIICEGGEEYDYLNRLNEKYRNLKGLRYFCV